MVGGRIGKDGIHGATFSSLALDEASPASAVQLGDPLTQKRVADFILQARELGLYRAITDNGAGGLSSSVGEMALLSNGAFMDVSLAKTKYPGLKPYELVVSESQERMTLAVPPTHLSAFFALAERRGVEVSDLGEFTDSGKFEIAYAGRMIASLDLKFLHHGVPRLELEAIWSGVPKISTPGNDTGFQPLESFTIEGPKVLLDLLARPNIASKEWLIRQYDHEVQGMSVIKPLHTAAVGTANVWSGPNDAGVLKPKFSSDLGLAVGCGINPKLSDIDPFLMAQASVDEAIRNVLCVGSEYGSRDSVLSLVDNFCWPDPVGDPLKTAWLVRACYGLRDAALALSVPLISGKDSMKNDFRGKLEGKPVTISVPPTLLMTAVGRVPDIKRARTADFKAPGDLIYIIGPSEYGLLGSECQVMASQAHECSIAWGGPMKVGKPSWKIAQKTYSWIGEAHGKAQVRLKSLHDVSEGGLLVAVAECLLARGLGATVRIPVDRNPWEFMFGEGFHSFVGTISESDSSLVEAEWQELGIPFYRLGTVVGQDRLEVEMGDGKSVFSIKTQLMRSAWLKEGYWD
jgi:phosphoribosylformylglycinamidine synthase